jgi:thiol-disulfide isomerase/thioredoxin
VKKQLGNAVLVFLVVGAAATLMFEGATSDLLPRGSVAPAFEVDLPGGGRLRSEELKGQVVLLDFWATYCPPCREEMPWLVSLSNELSSKGVRFVAVSHDDPSQREALVAAYSKRVPGLERYAAYGDAITGGRYRVVALPTLYVIGRDGKIAAAVQGSTSEWRVRRWLEAALEAE